MSICSDVFITLEEAREMAIENLLYDHKTIIVKAVEAMDDFELSGIINKNSYTVYYNINSEDKK